MSSYRKTMAEALQEVSLKNKLKVLDRKIKRLKDKAFKKTMSTIKSPLFADNEIEEGRMKDIFTADQEGKSAEEIAKIMKLPLKTVKGILGEGIKPYVSMQRDKGTGKMNYVVLDKDEKEAFRSTNQTVAQDYFKKNFNKLKEETIVEFSDAMLDKLKREYEPLKGKTISVDQANKLRKIFSMIPDRALDALRKKKIPFLSGLALSRMVQKGMPVKEELEETPQGYALVQKAKEIAKKMANNYSGAVREIEKLQKGLSNNSSVQAALLKANESLEEKKSAFRISYSKDGQHAGFEDADTLQQIQRAAANLRMRGFTIDKMGRNTSPVKEENEKEIPMEPKKDNEKKESENKDNTIASLKDQIAMLKTKLENEKNKAIKPEPNPDTGEVPLTVGVAYKHFKDKKEKEEVKEANMVSDISGISIAALKREAAKFKIKVARVTPGGPMGAEYEVTFTGAEKDLIAYAKEHLGFDDKPGTYQQLKKHLNMDYVPEKAMSDRDKRIQRAKDMIKYYDAQKKAALKGKNKDLAKKMLKNDLDEASSAEIMKKAKEFGITAKMTPKGIDVSAFKSQDGMDKFMKFIASKDKNMINLAKVGMKRNFEEADLSKKQIKMVHKVADDLPKKDFKDRYGKEKGDAVRFGTATNMVKKKLGMKEDRRLYVESLAGLKKKSEKSGMPYSILKKVFDRGMAAWKSGHRPGASQQQWAYARVNSFITKSSGTWGGADKDLAKQVRGK